MKGYSLTEVIDMNNELGNVVTEAFNITATAFSTNVDNLRIVHMTNVNLTQLENYRSVITKSFKYGDYTIDTGILDDLNVASLTIWNDDIGIILESILFDSSEVDPKFLQ